MCKFQQTKCTLHVRWNPIMIKHFVWRIHSYKVESLTLSKVIFKWKKWNQKETLISWKIYIDHAPMSSIFIAKSTTKRTLLQISEHFCHVEINIVKNWKFFKILLYFGIHLFFSRAFLHWRQLTLNLNYSTYQQMALNISENLRFRYFWKQTI